MIEINLVPDVKLELIKAKRVRAAVVSMSILTSIVAGGVVLLLALYTFGVQSAANLVFDSQIDSETKKLQSVNGLGNMLTIQKQLGELQDTHSKKLISSQLVEFEKAMLPKGANKITINGLTLDVNEGTIMVEAEAANGYEALEVFKKTLAAVKFRYNKDGQATEVPAATDIKDISRSFGEGSDGKKALRFSLSFTYAPEIFSSENTTGSFVTPKQQDATDSKQGVPNTIFKGEE